MGEIYTIKKRKLVKPKVGETFNPEESYWFDGKKLIPLDQCIFQSRKKSKSKGVRQHGYC